MSHFIKYCSCCKKVMSQCRCPSPDKEVQYGVCEQCLALQKKKEDENNFDVGVQRYSLQHYADASVSYNYIAENCEGEFVAYVDHTKVVEKACKFYDELLEKVKAKKEFEQELVSLLVDIKQDYLVRLTCSGDDEYVREFVTRIKNYLFKLRNQDE